MLALPTPPFSVSDILDNVRDTGTLATRERIASATEGLIGAEAEYRKQANRGSIHLMPASNSASLGGATETDIISVYENRLVRPRGRAHRFYEEILYVGDGTCSLCGASAATEVDHYLPKEQLGWLAIVPLNMIPACSECNGYKGTRLPSSRNDSFIHPYFDDFRTTQWLAAEVREDDPLPRYFVQSYSGAGESDIPRLKAHFVALRLGFLYARLAGGALAEYRGNLIRNLSGESRFNARRLWLEVGAKGLERDYGINHWRAVALRAWAASDWFIEEGYATEMNSNWVLQLARRG